LYRTQLCLGLIGLPGLSPAEEVRLFRQIGFEGFFAGWSSGCTHIPALRKAADETGMLFQSLHAPFGHMADLWKGGEHLQDAVDELTGCLRDCHDNGVGIMVAHAFIGFEDHTPTEMGLSLTEPIVREAENLGVQIAFENTEGEEYLAALMEHFRGSKHVGFCLDTGHEICYNYSKDMLSLYGDRLIATHLNDNLGIRDFSGQITWIDDLHLLPFDGVADWHGIAARLNHHHFSGPLTFELTPVSKPGRHENDAYGRMSPEDYVTAIYNRACRVATLMQRQKNAQ